MNLEQTAPTANRVDFAKATPVGRDTDPTGPEATISRTKP